MRLEYIAQWCESLYRVFRIVVVPWYVVEIQKREHCVAVLLQAFDDFCRGFARTESAAETLVESVDKDSVLSQKSFL